MDWLGNPQKLKSKNQAFQIDLGTNANKYISLEN